MSEERRANIRNSTAEFLIFTGHAKENGIEAFQKRFGMTFLAYARARRLGMALKQIKGRKAVIDAQIDSGSGFWDAFFES